MLRFTFLLTLLTLPLVSADFDQGKQLYAEGKYADAESELRKVVAEQPDNVPANLHLGMALLRQEKLSDASVYLNKADEVGSSGETKIGLAQLYVAQKDFEKAAIALDAAGDGAASAGDELEYVRGVVAIHRKNWDEAAQNLESYSAKKPDSAYAHYYAGLAYNGLRRTEKMMMHFEKFLRLKPDAPEARKVRTVLKTGR